MGKRYDGARREISPRARRLGATRTHDDFVFEPGTTAELGRSDRERGQRGPAAAAVQDDSGARQHSRYEILHDRAAGRPRLAPFPRSDATGDWWDRHYRHPGGADYFLPVALHG